MALLEIFWSFRSPYSYLAIDRLEEITSDFEVETKFRPVRPLAMREPDFFSRGRPQFLPYLFRDVARESERLGIPFAAPRPDPIAMNMMTGKVDAEQPIMDRMMRLAVSAAETGRGLEFARAAAHKIWRGVENWHDDANLSAAAKEAGLDLSALESWASDHADEVQQTIARNEEDQLKHHWGVPLMVFDDEPFFGQDRLDSLVWRLEQRGLEKAPR